MIKNFYYPLCLFILISCFITTTTLFRSVIDNVFIAPDEAANYISITTFAKTYNFKIENQYSQSNNLKNIKPIGFLSNKNYFVPSKFFGMSLFYGIVYKVINDKIFLLTPIIGGAGLLITYYFTLLVSGSKKLSLLSAILLAFFPPYFWWSRFSYLENIFGSVLFFLGFYLLTHFIKKKSTISLYLASLFFSFSCGVRPDYSVLFILPLCIFLFFFRKEIGIKKLIVCITIFFLTILPIFYFNNSLYGNFLMTGTHYGSKWSTLIPLDIKLRSQSIFLLNFNNTFVEISGLFLFSLIGLLLLIKNKTRQCDKYGLSYFIYSITCISIFSYILLSGVAPKMSRPLIVQESYIRYFLPLYICILPGLSIFIGKLKNTTRIFIITVYFIFSVIFLSNQITYLNQLRDRYVQHRNSILNNTENNSIIFIDYNLAKTIYPNRQAVPIDLSDKIDVFNTISNSIISLIQLNKSIPIYIYSYINENDIEIIKKQLFKNKINLVKTNCKLLYKMTEND